MFLKLNQIGSLNQALNAAENLFSDFNQQGIQVVQQPDGRIVTIRDTDLKQEQPYLQFVNTGYVISYDMTHNKHNFRLKMSFFKNLRQNWSQLQTRHIFSSGLEPYFFLDTEIRRIFALLNGP